MAGHPPRIVDELLAPLARAGALVLIGTRRGVKDWAGIDGPPVVEISLDDDAETVDAIREHVERRLVEAPGSPYRGIQDTTLVRDVASAVTKAATDDGRSVGGGFLLARMITKTSSPVRRRASLPT